MDYLRQSKEKIARVVAPLSGQSYNPSTVAHQEIIAKVIDEELEDLEKDVKLLEQMNPDIFD